MTISAVAYDELAPAVEPHLLADERLLWIGRPDPTKHFSRADWFLVPFSVLWAGFALFWEASTLVLGAPAFFPLFGLMFVVVGLYFAFGRFLYKAHRKRRTVYAVTNERVLEIVGGRSGDRVAGAFVSSIPAVATRAGRDGIGTVSFGSSGPLAFYGNTGLEPFAGGLRGDLPTFYDIPEAASVAELVTRLRLEQVAPR